MDAWQLQLVFIGGMIAVVVALVVLAQLFVLGSRFVERARAGRLGRRASGPTEERRLGREIEVRQARWRLLG